MLMHFLLMTAKQDAKELGMELPEAAAQAIVHLVAGLHSEIICFMEEVDEDAHVPFYRKDKRTAYGTRWSQEEVDRFEVELNRSMKDLMGQIKHTLCQDVYHTELGVQEFLCPTCGKER